MIERAGPAKSDDAYRTISEVADELKLPQHVLRFWETRFIQVKPLKRAGGRRFYRPEDVALLRAIKTLLYGQGYTIKGVQRMLQEQGPRGVAAIPSPSVVADRRGPRQGEDGGPTGGERSGAVAVSAGSVSTQTAYRTSPPSLPAPPLPAAPTAHAGDLRARLNAVVLDLSECSRLIAAVRTTRN